MHRKGLFITFEGPDGCGKTTCLKELVPWLTNLVNSGSLKYNSVFLTREPGGTDNLLAERIRNLVLDTNDCVIPDRTEALLFAASRSAHVELTIKPHLENNDIILCDRFVDSSIVYQGGSRKLGIKPITDINKFATNGIKPDLTFLLMVSAEVGLNRIVSNKRDMNRLDFEDIKFHRETEQFYRELYEQDQDERIIYIDANQPKDKVLLEVKRVLLDKIRGFNE